jgi:hypothetical protein
MTTVNRTVTRESAAHCYSRGKSRPVVVEIQPPGRLIGFRLKGERKTFYLAVSDCYSLAVRTHVEAEKERRKAERKARQKAKTTGGNHVNGRDGT